MVDINSKLFGYFDQGKIKEAIIGNNSYFIPDVTYREQHDRLLVLRQLCIWGQTIQKIKEASISIEEVIEELYLMEKFYEFLDVVWCFLLVQESDQCIFTINIDRVQNKLSAIVKKNYKKLTTNDELRDLVISLSSKLPKFKNELHL